MRSAPRHLLLALLALCAVTALPATAGAVDLPNAIDDPAAAIAPDPDPAPAPAADPVMKPDVEATAAAHAPALESAPAPAVAAPTVSYRPAAGTALPFTGTGDGQLVLAFLVGSLLVCGGVVLSTYAAARA